MTPDHPAQTRPPVPGEGWEIGDDGMPFRRAARLVLFAPDGRVLLATGHDVAQPERRWLFTPGGGIDPGETSHEAAVRELAEESGIVLDVDRLVGPVAVRSSVFDFYERSVRQDEVFFRAVLPENDDDGGHLTQLDDSGWTDVERAFMEELGWWNPADLAFVGEDAGLEMFPRRLPELVEWLAPRWDGDVWRLDV
ncbi:NUDIX hydrolase [Salana multivorans]